MVNVTRTVSGRTVREQYEGTETTLSEHNLNFAVKGHDRFKLQNMTLFVESEIGKDIVTVCVDFTKICSSIKMRNVCLNVDSLQEKWS